MAFYFHILTTMHGQNHIKQLSVEFVVLNNTVHIDLCVGGVPTHRPAQNWESVFLWTEK